MKKIIIILVCLNLHQLVFSQVLEEVDAVYPFQDELAAVKKGDQWAFINMEGVKVIDFRDDLVSSKKNSDYYPMFVEGKCLVKNMIDGEYRFGYINKEGTIIIKPQYLNATNFIDGYAMVIKLDTSKMGSNNALGKRMINSKLEEYIIDASGKIVKFLDNSRGYIPSTTDTTQVPKFISKFIAPRLAAVKKSNGKWDVYKF